MFFMYGVGLFLWIMFSDAGSKKSLEVFDISETKNIVSWIARIAVVVFVVFIMSLLGIVGERDYSRVAYFPILIPFYYGVYVLLYLKERDSWKEFLRIDRWNALVLLGCICLAFCSTVIK